MSNGRLTIELDTRIDDLLNTYGDWLNSQTHEAEPLARLDRSRASLEDAISEAIARGPLEHAEPETAARVDCSELEQALAAAKQNGLTQYNRFAHLRDKCEKHSQRLARLSAWLEVLAEGHITPEGVTVGARRGVESLRTVVYDLLS